MEDRHALLQKINEISFVFNDLTLYLDTHPMDSIATLDCSCEYHSWAEGPTPWEGGHI